MADVWETHNGTNCTGMNWERFTGLQQAQVLVIECAVAVVTEMTVFN
jgi:hypothetical protein